MGRRGVYALVIALFTLTSRPGASGALDPTLVPFESLVDLLRFSTRRAIVTNIVGNVLLFAPLAVLLRLLVLRSAARALLLVLLASVFIELAQGLGLTDGRQANVDDVILNVGGAAVALVLLRLARDAPRS